MTDLNRFFPDPPPYSPALVARAAARASGAHREEVPLAARPALSRRAPLPGEAPSRPGHRAEDRRGHAAAWGVAMSGPVDPLPHFRWLVTELLPNSWTVFRLT